MDVTLKVVAGTNVGQELAVAPPRFFIGRAEDCQLRPKSDLISRHHCVLLVDKESLAVRDLGSRNGTFVNDERVMGERELQMGDRLKVGALEFVVHLAEKAAVGPAKKRPKVNSIEEVVARTVEGAGSGETDVASWLEDEPETSVATRELRPADAQAAEIHTDAGMTMTGAPVIVPDAPTEVGVPVAETISTTMPGKPAPPKPAAKGSGDSGAAAADVLRQFFRRR